MQRIAWGLLLVAACGKADEPKQTKPITKTEELDKLPNDPNRGVAPKQQQLSIDQIMPCFSEPLTVPAPDHLSSITLGDFDGDGRNDAVVTYDTLANDVFTGHVDVYRNTGDAKLVAHSSIGAGDMVYAVSKGDIDNDGKLDLAVGDPRGGKTRLYAGNGDGTFTEKRAIVAGRKPYGTTLVDLDGDGKLDMIAELFSDVQIYKGDGAFGFKKRMTIDTGQAPDGPVVADFDGDGKLDLGYAANDEGYFFMLKGPAFKQSYKATAACGDPGYVSGGDLDNDGDMDVVYPCGSEKIELQFSDGKGGFRAVTHAYGPGEDPINVADLTGDGKADLLISHRANGNDWASKLVLLAGQGDGVFAERATGTLPIINAVDVADMDGDKRLDIVLATWTGNKAAIMTLLAQDCKTP